MVKFEELQSKQKKTREREREREGESDACVVETVQYGIVCCGGEQ